MDGDTLWVRVDAGGGTVYLLADVEDHDRYARLLRYLWTEDGTFFNLAAMRAGMCRATVCEPNRRRASVPRRPRLPDGSRP